MFLFLYHGVTEDMLLAVTSHLPWMQKQLAFPTTGKVTTVDGNPGLN